MFTLLNLIFAWIAVLCGMALMLIAITKRMAQRNSVNKQWTIAGKLTRWLRKTHKPMGVWIVIAGLIHGLLSSDKVWELNWGTACWILAILLGMTFMFRKQAAKFGGWMLYHRLLTVVFIAAVVWHVVDVGGIHIHEVAQAEFENFIATKTVESRQAVLKADAVQTQEASTSKSTDVTDGTTVSDVGIPQHSETTVAKQTSPSLPNGNQPVAVVKTVTETETETKTVSSKDTPSKAADTEKKNDKSPADKIAVAKVNGTKTDSSKAESVKTASIAPVNSDVPEPAGTFKEGIFTGTAKGYKDGLKVEVTVANGKLVSIVILEHHEVGERYYSEAMAEIPKRMVEEQQLEVDAVTGATRTSEGIMNAAKQALGF